MPKGSAIFPTHKVMLSLLTDHSNHQTTFIPRGNRIRFRRITCPVTLVEGHVPVSFNTVHPCFVPSHHRPSEEAVAKCGNLARVRPLEGSFLRAPFWPHKNDFAGYKTIPGTRLSPWRFERMSKANRLSEARRLGRFLTALHKTPLEPVRKLGVVEGDRAGPRNRRKAKELLKERGSADGSIAKTK